MKSKLPHIFGDWPMLVTIAALATICLLSGCLSKHAAPLTKLETDSTHSALTPTESPAPGVVAQPPPNSESAQVESDAVLEGAPGPRSH